MRKSLFKVLVASAALLGSLEARPCTNVIISRGASKDGSVLVSYAADSHTLYGELYYKPARDWKKGSKIQIYDWDTNKPLAQIPQVSHTYQTVGNMNEFQLIITETTWGGRPELEDKNGGIDYGSLIYITLQRARTAREAIDLIVKLAKEIPGLEVNVPEGAFYLFPKCSSFFGKSDGQTTINNSTDFAMYLLEKGHVATVGGDAFGDPECFRMSYATSDENIIEAMRRMKQVLADLK